MEKFVDRDEELDRLRALFDSDKAELAVIYGRRRIGKTGLVTEAVEERDNTVYYQAIETTKKDQIESFIASAGDSFPEVENLKQEWEPILKHLIKEDATIILDEFPYLVDSDESLPSKLQRIWDHETDDSKAKLVLTGSSIGMMYDIALEGGSPLYGRVSQNPNGEFSISQLPFTAATEFFQDYSYEEKVLAFSIFGGTPHYLNAIKPEKSIAENVQETIISQSGGLHNEPETVLRMELEEVNRYFATLKSLARGNRSRNEIINETGIDQSSAGYYLDRLEKLHIIQKDHPVTEDPRKSRKTRYRIRDQFFRFWFRFVYGQTTRYNLYGEKAYQEFIEPELADFSSDSFEELCHKASLKLHPDLKFRKIGRWWRKEREIDVVGLTDSDEILVGEAKFTSSPLGYDTLSRLEEDAEHLNIEKEKRYALFSRNGFKESVKEADNERENLYLHNLEEILDSMS
ncbi:MAG: ATP-binding protein [Candidatus Nanohaloarchaea archaeon]